MERAVDPALLALALGQHTSGELPSAAELTEMIASIEIALVRGVTNELDSRLEPAAWYLHGIASSSIVANAYSPERQARAFAVSAHAFDLLLNQPDLDDKQRLALAFAAQVGYHRADLTPNSTAIYRRMREELGAVGEPGLDLENTALRLGIAFLGLDHRGRAAAYGRGGRRRISWRLQWVERTSWARCSGRRARSSSGSVRVFRFFDWAIGRNWRLGAPRWRRS